jgi:hypothetical protein
LPPFDSILAERRLRPIEGNFQLAVYQSTLFSSQVWFDLWLAAFGGEQSGYWSFPGRENRIRIPYVIWNHQFGILRLKSAVGAANTHTPRFDVWGSDSPAAEDLREMMRALKVSALIFPLIAADSKLGDLALRKHKGVWKFLDDNEMTAYVQCTGRWDEYLKSRSKSSKSDWLYHERKALKARSEFVQLSTWHDVASCLDEVLDVEASGWKGREGSAIKQSEAARKFYRQLAEELANQGKLRLFLMRRDLHIVAFQFCTLDSGILTSLKIGFREEFADESPGQVLQLWVLKWAFGQPTVRLFDMLGPVTATKRRWATGQEPLYTLYVFRWTPGGVLMWLRYSVIPSVKPKIFTFIARLRSSGQAEGRK